MNPSRIFALIGALVGFLVIPVASLCGGFVAIVHHGYWMARDHIENHVLPKTGGPKP